MTSSTRSALVRTAPALVCGAMFGWLTSAVNHGLGGETAAYVSKVLGTTWGWLVAGLIATWPGRSWKDGFLRGVAFYAPAVLAYYLADLHAGVYDRLAIDLQNPADTDVESFVDIGSMAVETAFYVVAGAAASALLSGIHAARRHGGLLAVSACVALPAYIAFDAFTAHRELYGSPVPIDPVSAIVTAAVGWVALAVSGIVLVHGVWRYVIVREPVPSRD